jgi:hypothetical protein
MKKIFTLLFLCIWGFASSQDNITITLEGQVDDLSSGASAHQVVAPSSATFDIPFDVKNNGTITQVWRIARYQVSVPTGWTDGLCWGSATDPFGGICFSSSQMTTNPWTTPGSSTVLFDIEPNDYGKMKVSVDPADDANGSAHYRYYITGANGAYLDSVDLIADYIAKVKPTVLKEPLSVTIVPNPATEYINVNLSRSESISMKIVDVLGNLILKETLSSSKKVDVSDLRSGVYFIVFEGSGFKSFSRKVIIRH